MSFHVGLLRSMSFCTVLRGNTIQCRSIASDTTLHCSTLFLSMPFCSTRFYITSQRVGLFHIILWESITFHTIPCHFRSFYVSLFTSVLFTLFYRIFHIILHTRLFFVIINTSVMSNFIFYIFLYYFRLIHVILLLLDNLGSYTFYYSLILLLHINVYILPYNIFSNKYFISQNPKDRCNISYQSVSNIKIP